MFGWISRTDWDIDKVMDAYRKMHEITPNTANKPELPGQSDI